MNILEGICASEGASRGPVIVVGEEPIEVDTSSAKNARVEMQRFWTAKERAKEQIRELLEKSKENAGSIGASIFEAYMVYLDDIHFKNEVESLIINENMKAEQALYVAGEKFANMVSNLDNPRMQARAIDVRELMYRMIVCLDGSNLQGVLLEKPHIIVARDLPPSILVNIKRENLIGFVLEEGSNNSHFAILARSMEIPVVIQAAGVLDAVSDGTNAALDATHNTFVIEPTEEKIQEIRDQIARDKEEQEQLEELKGLETVTNQGEKIMLYANVSSLDEIDRALKNDAEGIGLFRTEFIFLSSKTFPTEEEQFLIYREAIKRLEGRVIAFRTADIGGDKRAEYMNVPASLNPAMGVRGIRYSMCNEQVFKTQLRALYRAAYYAVSTESVHVMYPMISTLDEVDWIEEMNRQVIEELEADCINYAIPRQGVVIETPAAALIADVLAKRFEFFSIGTNDLSQFTFGKDRMNQQVGAEFFENESMRRLIKQVLDVADKAGIPVGICGDIKGHRDSVKWLLELGFKGLSVQPRQVLLFRKYISEL